MPLIQHLGVRGKKISVGLYREFRDRQDYIKTLSEKERDRDRKRETETMTHRESFH